MKKAVVFGATGQDGSYLAELLLDEGYEVVGVTRRSSVDTTERIENAIDKYGSQFIVVEGDVTDAFCVSDIINKYEPDEVYNLAAQSHVGTSFKQPTLTWEVTAGGCLNILEAIRVSPRKNEIKFYQASSSEMFGKNYSVSNSHPSVGDSLVGTSPPIKYQNEETPFIPQSPYAVAKLAAHHLVRIYRDSYGIFGSNGILFNHESERRGENFVTRKITKYVAILIDSMESEKVSPSDVSSKDDENLVWTPNAYQSHSETIYPKLRLGNLEARRDWGHAKDYVRAMWLMLQQEEPDDYVVATGETHSVKEFLEHAFRRVGILDWSKYVYIDPEFFRPAEVDFLLGDASKARKKLGWVPEITFNELVEKMIDGDLDEELLGPYLQAVQD
jgi:GDPmannose 4,6-dehydratase|tara:strand:+ start:724 stop:1884 length:1161 start_codon:yes stop_codon:yes gene_type:complete